MEMAWDACHPPTSICLNRKSGSLLLSVSPSFSTPNMAHQMGIVSFYFYIGVIYLFCERHIVDCLALFSGRLFFWSIKGEIERSIFILLKDVSKIRIYLENMNLMVL